MLPYAIPPTSGAEQRVNPDSVAQWAILHGAMNESKAYTGKMIRGPHLPRFEQAAKEAEKDRQYRIERLAYPDVIGPDPKFAAALGEELATESESTTLLRLGVLACPLERRTKGDGEPPSTAKNLIARSCMNACVRMVLDSIMPPGWVTDELILRQIVTRIAHDYRPQDHRYLNIFGSTRLREVANRRVTTAIVAGASLAYLNTLATNASQKRPGTETYCITPLFRLEGNRRDVTHNVILLGQQRQGQVQTVKVYDPTPQAPSHIEHGDFAHRWALCNNVAMLVMAQPRHAAAAAA